MKKVRTTHCTFVFTCFFTLWREQFLSAVRDREAMQAKVTVEKTPNRAGATPLFGLSAAQKVSGVAPALGTVSGASDFFRRAQRVSEIEP